MPRYKVRYIAHTGSSAQKIVTADSASDAITKLPKNHHAVVRIVELHEDGTEEWIDPQGSKGYSKSKHYRITK